MSISVPNSLLYNNYIYKFRDLAEIQMQAKITNFFIQINDKNLLGLVTKIRLLQLQYREWLCYSPLHDWPYKKVYRRHYKSFLASMISYVKANHFSFNLSIHNS